MSGNVMYLPVDRVRPLGITMVQAMAIVKRMGVGSAKALSGADLTLPAGAYGTRAYPSTDAPRKLKRILRHERATR